jgi:sirohydrochlorin ferrochelatase
MKGETLSDSEKTRACETSRGIKTILLVAHGSRYLPANEEVLEMAERLTRRLGLPVVPAFLELIQPTLTEVLQLIIDQGAASICVVPFFLGSGSHVTRDIPRILDEFKLKYPAIEMALTPAVGPDPLLDEIVVRRYGTCNSVCLSQTDPSGGNDSNE